MNAEPPDWDYMELFAGPDGQIAGIRLARLCRGGVTFEHSMHEPTIKRILPAAMWAGVHAAPVCNTKVESVDGWAVVLFGLGQPGSKISNLVMARMYCDVGFDIAYARKLSSWVGIMAVDLGIRLDEHMEYLGRRN